MPDLPDSPSPQPPASHTAPVGGDPVADRRIKLQKLREQLKVDPFGRRLDGLLSLADARARYDQAADDACKADPAQDRRPVVRVAGRVVLSRDIGKLIFMTLRDASGDLQIGISKKSVDDAAFQLAKLVDLGDLVVAVGPLGKTKTGEITVWAQQASASADTEHGPRAFEMAGKSLAAPPEKWHGLTDSELRYRQRYVDLWANPPVMQTMQLRMRIIEEIRQYLRSQGYMEVETPMLQPLHGGAAARPFITHHNALDMKLYLRIAPELYLKRLLVGGMPRVFEINRNFRNEGISPRHNPEFTMLEAYQAFGSWETMADMVEQMICTVAQKVFGTLKIEHKDESGQVVKTINLQRPWRRVRMVDLVEERTGWKFDKQPLQDAQPLLLAVLVAEREPEIRQQLIDLEGPEYQRRLTQLNKLSGVSDKPMAAIINHLATKYEEAFRSTAHTALTGLLQMSPAEQLVEVYEKLIEPTLIDPCFVTHVPSVAIPLARENRDDPFFADVYELAINGQEISPGYSELNDPDVQERHLRHQVGEREEQQQIDEDFLNALRVGMPPAGGMGLGIDRLVMMLTGAPSIRDVILFPLLKPQKQVD